MLVIRLIFSSFILFILISFQVCSGEPSLNQAQGTPPSTESVDSRQDDHSSHSHASPGGKTTSPTKEHLQIHSSFAAGWRELFNGEQPTWRILHSENGALVSWHRREKTDITPERRFEIQPSSIPQRDTESIRCVLPGNSCLVLGHTIGFPMLIEDMDPVLTIKSGRPGIVIGAQVVLPNTLHPATGKPVTYLVPGSRYSGSRDWERLDFRDNNERPNLLREVDRVGRVLRAEMQQEGLNVKFDTKDRYIRQIILFVEGNPTHSSQTDLWIDSLEVSGYMLANMEQIDRIEVDDQRPGASSVGLEYRFDPINFVGFRILAGSQCHFLQTYTARSSVGYTEWTSPYAKSRLEPLIANSVPGVSPDRSEALARQKRTLFSEQQSELRFALTNQQSMNLSQASLRQIQLKKRILHVDDIPIGVRAIEYRGEPLAFLRQLEFNTVWVKGRPTLELLQEAKDAGVWIICTPPGPSELEAAKRYSANPPTALERMAMAGSPVLDPIYDNVLVWNLGDECTNPEHPSNAQWATVLQGADRIRRRPILCTARSGVREYSRTVDILMMDRQPLMSSLDFNELAQWQKAYPNLARPDTAFWGTIQTDPDPKLANQWILFGGNVQDMLAITHEQIKMQVFQALAVGTHGLLFTSNTPLTNNDPATEYRRTSLELINWELQMTEEWFSSGSPRPSVIKTSKRGKMSSAVIQSGRTRLLIPVWTERESQLAVGGAVEGSVKYVISGIPETYYAYHLIPGQLTPLKTERVAGGIEVELEEVNLNTLIYFGEPDEVFARIEKNAKTIGPRAAYLACKLADMQLASTKQVLSLLKQAIESGTVPVHPGDNMPVILMQEYESDLSSIKETIERAKLATQQPPVSYSMAYIQAEKATRGLRVRARDLLRQATRHDLNPCMMPVSVSLATLPHYLAACQRLAGAALGPNRLPCQGGMEDTLLWNQSGWEARRQRVDGIASPSLSITHLAKHSGQSGLRIAVQATSLEEKPIQLETEPIWIRTPPVSVAMGEMLCVSGWVRIPKPLESSVDGLKVFDTLGGESQALRFLQTKGQWKWFAFYRYVPADGPYYVFFSMQGIGEVHLDDLCISSVEFAVPQPVPVAPAPTPTPSWQRLINPFQYFPPLPSWGGQ